MTNLEAYKRVISFGFICINCSCCRIMNGKDFCTDYAKCPSTESILDWLASDYVDERG
ncbi:hypothetical protein [Floccifex sp.]|uniref:hypothetical protein n=1 Tax=Floccifex sp. TaxID=2815810 RepID=UPI003EFBBE61